MDNNELFIVQKSLFFILGTFNISELQFVNMIKIILKTFQKSFYALQTWKAIEKYAHLFYKHGKSSENVYSIV